MARDFGAFYYSAWNDMDFRMLPDPAQSLYFKLVTHPTLSWAGVADWRPGKIAQMSQGLDAAGVRLLGDCLQSRRYIVIDEGTEEVLVRTYVKHDKLMRHPKLCVSMAKAFGDIGSNALRMVLVDELHKLREAEPDLLGWQREQVAAVLSNPRLSVSEVSLPNDPFSDGFTYELSHAVTHRLGKTSPVALPSVLECPTPAPTPAPLAPVPQDSDAGASAPDTKRKKPATPLPDSWQPSEANLRYASERGIDVEHQLGQFKAHHLARDSRFVNWDQAFRTWLGNVDKFGGSPRKAATSGGGWMNR